MPSEEYKQVRELNGYRVIFDPSNPSAMSNDNWNGWVYEHIAIAEKQIGRRLQREEVVHHLDFNRGNNRTENLLVLTKGMHGKLHAWLDRGAPGWKHPGMNRVNSGKSKSNEPQYCKVCGFSLQGKQKLYCSSKCYKKDSRKVERPSAETLSQEMKTTSWLALGRKYGVSGNAVKKWAKQYELI